MKIRWARRFPGLPAALFSWGLFLILLRYIWPYQGMAAGEVTSGTEAYAWIHQIPNMLVVPHIAIFGRTVPVMLGYYHGPWDIYLLTPFIALGGCTLATLRCYSAVMFFFALWGTWRLAFLASGDKRTAFFSALLLAVCPMMTTLRSQYISAPDVAASVWALCFALSFARTRRPVHAYAACAAVFLGLCTRAWVAGLGVGLLLYAALTWRHVLALLPESRAAKARLIGGCLVCAGVFLLPILAYNMANGWPTILSLLHHAVVRDPSKCGTPGRQSCSNLAYWTNLKIDIYLLKSFCDGGLGVLAREPWHWLYAAPLLLSLAQAVRDAWRRRTLWNSRAALWIIAAGYFLVSPISPTEQVANQLAPMAPILAVLMFSWISAVPRGALRAAALAAPALLCAAQFAGDFWLLRRKNIDVSATGWYGASPLVIEAARWAGRRPRTPVISLSFSFTAAAIYFSQNQVRLVRWPELSASYHIPWRRWLLRKDRPYFVTENDGLGAGHAAALEANAARLGLPLARVKVFRDSTGRPAFEVYQVR
ncbi:MAG TPA: glycosyltransferase family 39 protein [Elusimicrobiota bacterium]|nr:glycosyltransferase family 39 protein [Elusimicrobiota bacterium]